MLKKMRLWRGLTAMLAFLLAFSILMTKLLISWSGQVNVFLNVSMPVADEGAGDVVYDSEFGLDDEGLKAMLTASDAHDIQTMAEGAVLLKNENTVLPLAEEERSVTLFGRASADPVYRGNSGGPSMDESRQVSLYSGLAEEGFAINDTLFNAYADSEVKRVKADPDWFVGEVPADFYTDSLKASWEKDFNDAAVVMLSRDGGEGKDLATEDRDGISYLALHETEKEMLKMIEQSGSFGKTIVLINSAYPMELGWLDEEEYGVDAALWIGTPGLKGFVGVAQILTGKADPCGRLVDTYAADSLSAPAVRNSGDFTFANNEGHYVVNAEGIYVGYKYYETRYHDQVLGINSADGEAGTYASEGSWDYAAEMVYPYGYGTSYASFGQELTKLEWNRDTHTVTASVNVTNKGCGENSSFDGKSRSVVQLYASLPYEAGQAQKPAIQLIGFAKTGSLAEGESEEVTITVDDYLFAVYDMEAENGADASKKGCYVFDPGDYYFAIGNDSHDALNNVMAAKWKEEVKDSLFDAAGEIVQGDASKAEAVTLETLDNTTYAVSPETGEVVSNRFENIDMNYFAPDTVTYLSRDDWNTYPKAYTDLQATDEMIKLFSDDTLNVPQDAPAYDSFIQEKDSQLKFADMHGVAFDDPKWETFLNQLSLADMTSIVGENFGQGAVKAVNKPANANSDGPAGAQGQYRYGDKGASTVHVGEAVAASTWDTELLKRRGNFIAEDCLFVGTQQLWSPGANIHRTPFSGRNFEYYSEDSILSYIMSAAQTAGMQERGTNAAIKHFCANDQETNRAGLCVFMTEQTYRQGPLKGFEGAFTRGGALGTMMSFSRIGCVKMYQDAATLTGVLRKEWGFEGVTITDSVKGETSVYTIPCLAAGTDTFNADAGRSTEVLKYLVANKDGYVLSALREANKRFYYAMANSNLMNGISSETVVSDFIPWWHYALYAVSIILGILTAAAGVLFGYSIYKRSGYRKE